MNSLFLVLGLLDGVSAGGPRGKCCAHCPLSTAKMYSLTFMDGKCGESCVDPNDEAKFTALVPGLIKVHFGSDCYAKGWRNYDHTVTFPNSTMKVDLYTEALIQEPLDTATLYKISNGECGQATLDKKYESYAIKFAGLKEGLCSSQGYTESSGSKTIAVPFLGKITVETFKKAGALEAFAMMLLTPEVETPLDSVTLYKISGTQCGQATIDKKYETYAVKFAGLAEGTCTAQGFTVAAGSKDMHVPFLGHITVEMFNKAAASGMDITVELFTV